ncbi:MAG: sulfatase-like hydrolase/transferase [Planctomycetota bacterium]
MLNGLKTPPREPFFLYLHLIGPHDPYAPPPEARSFLSGELTRSAARFCKDRLSGDDVTSNTLAAMRHGLVPVDAETLAQMTALYDGEIAFSDAQIARILAAFEQAHVAERTIFIVTSDHGEEFREHGGLGHGRSQYRELLHAPLVVAGRHRPPASPPIRCGSSM